MWAYKSAPDRAPGIQSVIFDVGKAVTAGPGGKAQCRPGQAEAAGRKRGQQMSLVRGRRRLAPRDSVGPVRRDISCDVEIFLCLPLAFFYRAFILENALRMANFISYSFCSAPECDMLHEFEVNLLIVNYL